MEKRIQNDLMAAMKSKDEIRANTLRSVKAAILNEKSNGVHHELTDQDIVKIINKLIKLRKDAEDIYRVANRTDLADKEHAELRILEEYVPKKLNEAETKTAVESIIAEIGAASVKEKGRVIGEIKKKYADTIDMRIAVPVIDSLLK